MKLTMELIPRLSISLDKEERYQWFGEKYKRILNFDNCILQAENEWWPKVEMKASNEVYCASQMIPLVSRDINL